MAYPIVKLLHGSDKLDLMSAANGGTGRYKVSTDFAPPTAQRSVTLGETERGMGAVDKRLVNTDFVFAIHVKARTDQELERAKRELQSFLNRAGGATPLYLAYRSYDDYDYEPFFGLHGAFARYEIVHGYLDPSAFVTNSKMFIGLRVNLTIKPQAVFPAAKAGQATGGVFENYVGKADKRSRGTWVASSTTNKMTNPVFGHATYDTGWTALNLVAEKNTDPAYILFGETSVRLTQTAGALDIYYVQSINAGNTNTHTLSFRAKASDGAAITTSDVRARDGSNKRAMTIFSLGDGWYFCWVSFAGTASGTNIGVQLDAIGRSIYFDGFQYEELAYPTAMCYGDLLGCAWSGTKNASTSTRTAARIRYPYADLIDSFGVYSLRFVWTPIQTDYTRISYLCDDSDSALRVWIDADNKYNFQTSAASRILSAAVSLTAGFPEVIHVVYDGANAVIYRNGAALVSGTTTAVAAAPTYVYVGSENDATNHLGGTLMGFAAFKHEMTAAEVLADYTSLIQQATDGDRLDPLPWLYTVGGDSIIDNDNYATDSLYNFGVVGGLMGDDVDIAYKLDSSNTFVLGPGVTWGSLPVSPWLFDKDILTTGGTNTLLFINGSGTADTDANGDAVTRISLSTSESSSMATAITTLGAKLLREVKGVVGYFVAKDAGTNTNVQVRLEITTGSNSETYYASAWRTLATSAAFRPFVTAELPLDFEDPILDSARKLGFRFKFKRTAGASTQNFDISHAVWLTNYAAVYTGDVGATVGVDMAYVRDRLWEGVDDASPTLTIGRRIFNRALVIKPEYLNILMLQHTYDNYAASKTTWTTGYNLEVEQFAVTPRFDIY